MRAIVRQGALAYDGQDFAYADLVLAGILTEVWPALERRASDGVAATRALAASGGEVPAKAVRAAIVTFRKERGLIAGDDYRAWRDARDLTSDDIGGYLERELATREVYPDDLEAHRPDGADVAPVMRVHAICSGTIAGLARTLATWAAAARGLSQAGLEPGGAGDPHALAEAARACAGSGLEELSDDELTEHARDVSAIHAAYEHFAADAAAPDKVEGVIARHGMAWQHFTWKQADFKTESAAREAIMLVREDGMDFAEVAHLAGAPAYQNAAYFDQLGKDVGGVLVATAPGELAGPLQVDGNGSWRLVQVAERKPASPDDPMLRRRAEDELVTDALERHLVGRVRVHGEL